MNQYKVTIPVTFALAAPTPREASEKCLGILMQLCSELFEHDILLDWGETDAQADDEELGEIGGGGGRTTASGYANEDGSAASIHVHEGQLCLETYTGKRGLVSDLHIIDLEPEKAAHWLVRALRVVHSHMGGGQ